MTHTQVHSSDTNQHLDHGQVDEVKMLKYIPGDANNMTMSSLKYEE